MTSKFHDTVPEKSHYHLIHMTLNKLLLMIIAGSNRALRMPQTVCCEAETTHISISLMRKWGSGKFSSLSSHKGNKWGKWKMHPRIYTPNFFTFWLYTGVADQQAVLVSGIQQSDSVIHMYISILFQILFPFRLLYNIELSSLCYIVGPYWLSILNIVVRARQSQTP